MRYLPLFAGSTITYFIGQKRFYLGLSLLRFSQCFSAANTRFFVHVIMCGAAGVQAIENSRVFINKAGPIMPMTDLMAENKICLKELQLGNAMMTEGLLASCLSNRLDASSYPCIQAELGRLTGRKVQESLCHPALIAAARAFIG